ncbi:MAG: glycosyltransferase family 2 protein [Alistipes sp.]
MTIAILLATYNSEKYLCEQLDSLFAQSEQNFTIYIHDDGSTDSTLTIIADYSNTNPKRIVLLADTVQGRGAKESFMWLLEKTTAEYYMFCDHDDFWLPNKIELTLAKMEQVEVIFPEKAIIVHTDLQVVDENLVLIHPSFVNRTKLKVHVLKNFNYIGVCNCVTGCTMMINEEAKKQSLPMSADAPMHDWWIAAKVASMDGIIDFVDQTTILYRQHATNVVGARDISAKYFVNKILHLFATLKGQRDLFPFHKAINYGGLWKFYWYKIIYTIKRNL